MKILSIIGVLILSGAVPEKPQKVIEIRCPTPTTCYEVVVYRSL